MRAVNTVAGSVSAYLVSLCCGRDLVAAVWPDRLQAFAVQVADCEHVLLSYVTLLRIAPFLPNVFINLAAPIVGIPLRTFALGTLLGAAPGNAILVSAGARLSEVMTWRDLYSRNSIAVLGGGAALALTPVYLRHRRQALPCAEARPAKAVTSGAGGGECVADEVPRVLRREVSGVLRVSMGGEPPQLHQKRAKKGT